MQSRCLHDNKRSLAMKLRPSARTAATRRAAAVQPPERVCGNVLAPVIMKRASQAAAVDVGVGWSRSANVETPSRRDVWMEPARDQSEESEPHCRVRLDGHLVPLRRGQSVSALPVRKTFSKPTDRQGSFTLLMPPGPSAVRLPFAERPWCLLTDQRRRSLTDALKQAAPHRRIRFEQSRG